MLKKRIASKLDEGGEKDGIGAESEWRMEHDFHFTICLSIYQIAFRKNVYAAAVAADDDDGSVSV